MLELLEEREENGWYHRFFHLKGTFLNAEADHVVKRINPINDDSPRNCIWGAYNPQLNIVDHIVLYKQIELENLYLETFRNASAE